MSAERKRSRLIIALVALWVIFTVTLAGWWLVFGLRQLDLIKQSNIEAGKQLERHYQMLMWEGGILIASLIGGGLALFYYAKREQRRHAQVEEFFAAFTHDAKTALASLRLQAESLREDFAQSEANPLLERLLGDTLRLQLQLENSLFLVNLPRGKFFLQPIRLSDRIDALRLNWPDLTITLTGDAAVMADARALESVMTNLVQNSVIHGHANEVNINVRRRDGRVSITVIDNGQGFKGDLSQLGKLFVRHARSSGSGVGLYIVQQLAKAMHGTIQFCSGEESGFVAELDLPEAVGTHASGVPSEAQHAGRVRTPERAGGVRTPEHAGRVRTPERAGRVRTPERAGGVRTHEATVTGRR
ncbi:MAG TPA: HAMP domain-containing sensor histidine kinase [Pyrinomonadaceae bacterium]|nr:HAMP domain-containing sensor histidine kinase [Pyrinomonadaceae bacterium]